MTAQEGISLAVADTDATWARNAWDGLDALVGDAILRLAADDNAIRMIALTRRNEMVTWEATFSAGTPVALLTAAIAEALALLEAAGR